MTENDGAIDQAEAIGMGAALAMSVYGLVLICGSLFADKLLIPEEMVLVLAVMVGVAVLGAIVGAGLSKVLGSR